MKTKILTVIFLLVPFEILQAAHLTGYSGGGLWGQLDRQIITDSEQVLSSPVSRADNTYVSAEISGDTDNADVYARMYGNVSAGEYWEGRTSTALEMFSTASCSSLNATANIWAYGDVSAVVPANTDGIFFTIVPDEGETVGTPVRVQLHWSASWNCYTSNEAYPVNVNIGSFGSNNIYITRNIQPPVNELPVANIVWSREMPDMTDTGGDEHDDSFIAEIGDTIGIFMNAGTRVDFQGVGSANVNVSTNLQLLADEAIPSLVEYSYAPGLVYDTDQNITFLKDWSTFPDPNTWADANELAENFVYYSGGVTYSNWRLPATTDQQGAAGELGYLNSNYGISSLYFGPFTNLRDGDYWTGPTFSHSPDPDIAYTFTYSTIYGPAQYWQFLTYENGYLSPVFDGPPREHWCPADFDNDGIVDFRDFAIFASYWLNERP